ncbi:MAG TPA: 50S ribosomal protein L21 [Caulobacteraceae bacterium]|jgi:large subunit ribosomal protein L21|nr:50S ribosomal protein L21 [Caulobacteraceae bacterium]
MYAVIKTGGKQYRVQPGDLLVVEKLDGDVGAELSFDQVLMLGGDGGEVTVGAPVVEGALVRATLIETRKGDKVKIFKKIRRQGYRRTKGHRQHETVLRVTGLEGAGINAKWDGTVDLTPRSVLNARARNLAPRVEAAPVEAKPAKAAKAEAPAKTEAAPKPAKAEAAAKPKAAAKADAPAKAAAADKPKAPKASKPKA